MGTPEVTVLMSVYNGEPFLRASVESILNQSFRDFEFIIVDDGSTDNTLIELEKIAARDHRVIIISQTNRGLTKALNHGASLARGDYIARQDADDVSMPNRIEKQLEYLKKNPDVSVLGSNCVLLLNDKCMRNYVSDIGCDDLDGAFEVDISKQNFIPHSSAFFRKDIFNKCGGYDENFKVSQDFELWNRMAKYGSIKILPQALVIRRIEKNGISRKFLFYQIAAAAKIRWHYKKSSPLITLGIILWFGLRHIMMSFVENYFICFHSIKHIPLENVSDDKLLYHSIIDQ